MAEFAVADTSKPLQVSQLTRYLKFVIEQDELLTSLSVEGEVCEFSRSAAGHIYFSIKDSKSQIACVLFRREAMHQIDELTQLRKGVVVVVHGFLTLYEPKGNYQIFVERVLIQGEGIHAKRFELLKGRFEAEGMFALERKRRLPPYPRTLALITSPGSQAYHDVLHRLGTQYPFVRVIAAGVSVQGDGAADEIVMALDLVNRLTTAEVILLVRGGGSPEDLAAFNDERLARAIFASRLPVVTGIGHETDHSIADFVADHRAATPSLAAAAAVPDVAALVDRLTAHHQAMAQTMEHRLQSARRQWLDKNRALVRSSPQNRLRQQQQRTDDLLRSSRRAVHVHLRTKRARLLADRGKLDALDPLAILSRGYAVLTDVRNGRVINSVEQVESGSQLRAQVADGEFMVRSEK